VTINALLSSVGVSRYGLLAPVHVVRLEDGLELGLQQLRKTGDAPDDAHRRTVELPRAKPTEV
jgi:hypothetical protein